MNQSLDTFVQHAKDWDYSEMIMPVLFIGHGAPLYTLDDNKYTRAWKDISDKLPKPKAIVCISAHWLTQGTRVTAMKAPKTIHDFGRMDDRLFDIQYPAPGDPALADEISKQLMDFHVEEDHEWGFDHGCWCVARIMYPEADVPILQFSIDYHKPAEYHYQLGKALSFLREKGVLVFCSGNIVHNLRVLKFPEPSTYDWAIECDEQMRDLMIDRNHQAMVDYKNLGQAARLSIPTPDHYYPLLYALGLQTDKDELSFPVEGIAYGSTSMRSVLLNRKQ